MHLLSIMILILRALRLCSTCQQQGVQLVQRSSRVLTALDVQLDSAAIVLRFCWGLVSCSLYLFVWHRLLGVWKAYSGCSNLALATFLTNSLLCRH